MELTNTQNQAVEKLVNEFVQSNQKNKKTIIDFQAPTGSGKTFIIANTINRIIQENQTTNNKLVFVITTLSSADLPIQMEQNLIEYKQDINGCLYSIERKESPSTSQIKNKDSVYHLDPEENKVIIFGSSSFGKGRILTEYGLFQGFLDQIKTQNYKLIYIRDEAHHGGNVDKTNKFQDYEENNKKLNSLKTEGRFEYQIQEAADFIIKMTATPKGKNQLICINEQDLENDSIKLLKNNHIYNEGIKNSKEDEIDDFVLLEQACKTFEQVRKKYAENNYELKNIRPAMLIQVENAPDKNKHPNEYIEFENNIEKIIQILNEHNLNWVKYFSNEKIESSSLINKEENKKINLKEISKNDANCDVILFKIGPATGWNIPRACMLVQLRNVSSKNLSIQTLGRIKRFPNPSFEKNFIPANSISDNYYVYSNLVSEDTFRQSLVLKEEFKNEEFPYGTINETIIKKLLDKEKYTEKIWETLNKEQIIKYFETYRELHNDKLIGEEANKKIENKTRVYTWICNSIELELFVEKSKQINKLFLLKEIENVINNFYEQNFGNNQNNKISINMYWYILIKKYFDQFKEIYTLCIKTTINNDTSMYEIHKNIKLPELNEILVHDKDRSDRNSLSLNNIKKYAYQNPKNINHWFDSTPEFKFIFSIKNLLSDNQNVKIYTKNPVFHGLKLQYFNSDYEIKNSFPDFIFKFESDKNTHIVYIEVKSLKSDYDPEKTKQLLESYKKYINNNKKTKEEKTISNKDKELKYTFLICYENQGDFYFLGGSEIDELNQQINLEIPDNWIANKQNYILNIKDLFKYFEN